MTSAASRVVLFVRRKVRLSEEEEVELLRRLPG